ncbi:MAG: hypothetical protein J3K34DRAFT_53980 [Monoraphidium minutum]|nr:MAG: hypothetical protein J3K34DRAFT_53980 [Monoraphidium minutum]
MNLTRAAHGLQGAGAKAPGCAPVTARTSRRRTQAFKGARRPSVQASAAESSEPSTAAPKQQRQGRAPRPPVTVPLATIQPGQEFEGTVRSVEAYGAFINIGSDTDGLVHVSQLSDGYVKNVADVVKVGAKVKVKVLTVDAGQRRLAFTMKGMGNAKAGGGGGGAAAAMGSFDADGDGDAEEEGFAFEAGDLAYDGVVFRVDEGIAEEEGYDEADEFEYEAEGEIADIAALENSLVEGKVQSVEDFGVVVEWADAKGAKRTGLLHVSEMRAPASKADAELGGPAAGGDDEGGIMADEGEFSSELYVDVGGIDKPSTYYKAGDAISCYVVSFDGGKVELTQDLASLALDDGVDDEGERGDYDEERLLAQAEADEDSFAAYEMEDEGSEEVTVVNAGFPSRGFAVSDSALRVAGGNLVDVDDAGDEAELVDYWTDDVGRVGKGRLAALGAKIVVGEEGEMEVVAREDAEAGEVDALELLAGISERDLDDLVDMVLADDEEDEAELPFAARRMPGVFAMSVETTVSAADVKKLRTSTGAGMMDCKKAMVECGGDFEKATEWLRQKGLSGADKKAGRVATEGAVARYIHPGSRLGVLLEVNCETDFVAASEQFQNLVSELGMIVASTDVVCVSADDMPGDLLEKERQVEMGKEDLKSKPEAVRAKIVEGRLDKIKRQYALMEQVALRDNNKSVTEIIKETIAAVGENIQVRRFTKFRLGEGLEKKANDFAAEVAQQTQAKAEPAKPKAEKPKEKEEKKPAVAVSAGEVKALRESTGAGMMDCKKALGECGGDAAAAAEWLRKKGLSGADKKAGRIAAEGAVAAYIHPGSRLGVLLEVNCETDFVAAGEAFNTLVNGLAMQIAASPGLEYVSADEIPAETFQKELEVEMGREDLQAKPEAIRQKIAEGRVKKIATERALLEQPYLVDPSKTVAEAVKATIAACGENVQVRRFSRFVLGEGMEKKVSDLAADVAAATGGKA